MSSDRKDELPTWPTCDKPGCGTTAGCYDCRPDLAKRRSDEAIEEAAMPARSCRDHGRCGTCWSEGVAWERARLSRLADEGRCLRCAHLLSQHDPEDGSCDDARKATTDV